jgi:23S rRNA pseudouridine1911/1915/1917 synthase
MPKVNVSFSSSVPLKFDKMTVLDYLSQRFSYQSQEVWNKRLQLGLVSVNGVLAQENISLNKKDIVAYHVKDYDEPAVPLDWKILWENDELFVVHKPAGIPVNRTGRIIFNTLLQLVKRDTQNPEANMLHRLDRETSGVMLFAKTHAGTKKWQKQIAKIMQNKTYHAIVHNRPGWQEKTFSCCLKEIEGHNIRSQMHVVDEGKWSETHFKVLEYFEDYSLLECKITTGRKHQIRAHLAYLGHPIVGDKIYNHAGEFYLKIAAGNELTPEDLSILNSPTHLLHAYSMDLVLGETTQIVTSESYSKGWLAFKKSLND